MFYLQKDKVFILYLIFKDNSVYDKSGSNDVKIVNDQSQSGYRYNHQHRDLNDKQNPEIKIDDLNNEFS